MRSKYIFIAMLLSVSCHDVKSVKPRRALELKLVQSIVVHRFATQMFIFVNPLRALSKQMQQIFTVSNFKEKEDFPLSRILKI